MSRRFIRIKNQLCILPWLVQKVGADQIIHCIVAFVLQEAVAGRDVDAGTVLEGHRQLGLSIGLIGDGLWLW